jgi:trimeric autotransporter adhesin
MKKVHVVVYSALLLLFSSALSQAQQSLASTRNGDSKAGSQAVSNVSGTGTKDYVPLWLSGSSQGNSNIFQSSGGELGIGTTVPAATLDVNGVVNAATSFNLGGSLFAFGTPTGLNAFVGFSGNSTMTGGANTASGVKALGGNTAGGNNTAIGAGALAGNTTGGDNTAIGLSALASNTTGGRNTASGVYALLSNTTGGLNTADGFYALHINTTGNYNAATGAYALEHNITGSNSTASGYDALGSNSTGSNNTTSGFQVLIHNTKGSNNTVSGASALYYSTTGSNNTANGYGTLALNTTGGNNTASGYEALYFNATGSNNTAFGYGAGPDSKSTNLTYATAVGAGAIVSQSNTLVLGGPLGSTGQVKVGIGTATPANVFTIAQGAGPAIADGWATYSSRRWKTNIETLHDALGKVEQLRGVSYELKANGKHEVGVIAEEVGAVVPEVVTWDQNGKDAQSVDYSRLSALLIEATKEQQALIERQQDQIAQLISQVKTIQASLKTSGRSNSEVRTVKADLTTVLQ